MYIPTPSWFNFRSAVKKLNDYCSSLVVARWDLREKECIEPTGRKEDVLDKILSAINDDEWGPNAIHQVQDEVKTFILAGHETSASMLTWSLYELLMNPDCMKKVKDEAEVVFGAGYSAGSVPTRSNLEVLQTAFCVLQYL